jgi:hypothetical protein
MPARSRRAWPRLAHLCRRLPTELGRGYSGLSTQRKRIVKPNAPVTQWIEQRLRIPTFFSYVGDAARAYRRRPRNPRSARQRRAAATDHRSFRRLDGHRPASRRRLREGESRARAYSRSGSLELRVGSGVFDTHPDRDSRRDSARCPGVRGVSFWSSRAQSVALARPIVMSVAVIAPVLIGRTSLRLAAVNAAALTISITGASSASGGAPSPSRALSRLPLTLGPLVSGAALASANAAVCCSVFSTS